MENKYKIGDILICVKYFEIGPIKCSYQYPEGIRIEILGIDFNSTYPFTCNSSKENHMFSLLELDENFILLAEWRDKQINSILYD